MLTLPAPYTSSRAFLTHAIPSNTVSRQNLSWYLIQNWYYNNHSYPLQHVLRLRPLAKRIKPSLSIRFVFVLVLEPVREESSSQLHSDTAQVNTFSTSDDSLDCKHRIAFQSFSDMESALLLPSCVDQGDKAVVTSYKTPTLPSDGIVHALVDCG